MQNVHKYMALLLAGCMLAACGRAPSPRQLLGELEWDRIALPAEVSEPILRIAVDEGATVEQGQLLVELDVRRTQTQLDAAQAEVARLEAVLDELRHGARSETIDAVRAQLVRAQSTVTNAKREYDRTAEIRKKGLISQADLDRANTALRTSSADASAARAQLAELLHGTRPEDLAQAQAALLSAQAKLQMLSIQKEHLSLHAPRSGRVDALPYKLGDQPAVGASVVSLLVGEAPYARVYIPEPMRAELKPGSHFLVHVDGITNPFQATLRSVRAEAAFTPYYALQGDDASRLSYRAELLLEGDAVKGLPAGLPVQAEVAGNGQH